MKKYLYTLILLLSQTICYAQGAGISRWYALFFDVDAYLVNNALMNNAYSLPIWQDSTVLQKVDTGYAPVKYASYYQIIDPIQSQIFNDPSFPIGQITAANEYFIDTIAVFGKYIRMSHQDSNQVDTLIVSVIPVASNNNHKLHLSKTQQANISWYTATDTVWAYSPRRIDTANLAAYGDTATTLKNRVLIKRPLTADDGDTPTTAPPTIYDQIVVGIAPPLKLNKGEIFGVTVSFKSGGTWSKNVSHIDSLHRFMPSVSYYKEDSAQLYYYEKYREHTTSGFMLTSNLSVYVPALFLEANSIKSYREEFVWLSAHAVCPDCYISVPHVNNTNALNVYPNPASNVVYFELKQPTHKKLYITITNSMGMVVAKMPIVNKTFWNTQTLPRGLYYYTLSTGRNITKSGTISIL